MELVSTIEINGEEREIADAYARGQIDGVNNNLSQLEYSGVAGGKNLFNYDEYTKNGRIVIFEVIGGKTLYRNANIGAYSKWEVLDADGNKLSDFNGFTSTSPMVLPVNAKYIKCNRDIVSSDVYIGYDSDISYEPYIPSVKMLAEEVSVQNDSLEVLGKCKNLLNPTLKTTTSNGVTCTANGDGTYTLNGASTGSDNWNFLIANIKLKIGEIYKFTFTNDFTDKVRIKADNNSIFSTKGYLIFENSVEEESFYLKFSEGVSFENLIIKPMLTTNLNVTYDDFVPYTGDSDTLTADVSKIKSDLSKQCKKDDITTNETLIGTFNGKNYYRKLFTGISGSGSSITVNVGEKIEIYNYYGRAYTYGQSGASDVKYPIPNKNYYIDSQNSSETSFQLTIPTSSDTRKVDLVIEYTKVDE